MESLIYRLRRYINIDRKALKALENASRLSEIFSPGDRIISEGDVLKEMFVIEFGWAYRYKILDDGRRQILNFMLPGDCFDIMSITETKSDHNVSAATSVQLRRIKAGTFLTVIKKNPKLVSAFWKIAAQEEIILRDQITRIGRRSATERLAHLILEFDQRISNTNDSKPSGFLKLPISQTLIADTLGISVVHASRTFTKLKSMKLIQTVSGGILILNRKKLIQISGFDGNHLSNIPPLKLAG